MHTPASCAKRSDFGKRLRFNPDERINFVADEKCARTVSKKPIGSDSHVREFGSGAAAIIIKFSLESSESFQLCKCAATAATIRSESVYSRVSAQVPCGDYYFVRGISLARAQAFFVAVEEVIDTAGRYIYGEFNRGRDCK